MELYQHADADSVIFNNKRRKQDTSLKKYDYLKTLVNGYEKRVTPVRLENSIPVIFLHPVLELANAVPSDIQIIRLIQKVKSVGIEDIGGFESDRN